MAHASVSGCCSCSSSDDDFPGFISHFVEEKIGPSCPIRRVQTARSSQQQVFILHLDNTSGEPRCWKEEICNGGDRLVVRIWKGSSRWWNLNHPKSIRHELENIARHEVWGYRTASKTLLGCNSKVCGPTVLHFSVQSKDSPSWAILEYIGPGSLRFRDDTAEIDTSWVDGMVKVRHEFGFPEPHPRWGRVPVEQAVDYALEVLLSVVMPLHTNTDVAAEDYFPTPSHSYESMVRLYHDDFQNYLAKYSGGDSNESTGIPKAVLALGDAIERLVLLCNAGDVPSPLPLKLCHLDLQPQNMVFGMKDGVSNLMAVFDWEEAGYADPRFELLMLGRKVCANKSQALEVWRMYEKHAKVDLGPIDPWLYLETVHSLVTLLLQATSGGGRSPWESKQDVCGKIDRELARLQSYGNN